MYFDDLLVAIELHYRCVYCILCLCTVAGSDQDISKFRILLQVLSLIEHLKSICLIKPCLDTVDV